MGSAFMLLGCWWLASAASAAGPGPEPVAAGPQHWLVVPVEATVSGQIPELYSALEVLGAKAVDEEARLGIDRRPNDELPQIARSDDVRASLLEAKAALRKLDVQAVETALETALLRHLQLAAPEAQRDLLADILLMRAELFLATGRRAAAEEELLLLTRVDVQRAALHPGLHAPALVQAFDEARRKNDDAALGTLVLLPTTVRGGEVQVLLDGEPSSVGTTRIRVGPHLVTASVPGAAARSWIVRIETQRPVLLDPFLAPNQAVAERERLLQQLQNAYRNRSPNEWAPEAELLRDLAGWTGAQVVVCLSRESMWLMRTGAERAQGPFAALATEPMAWAGTALSNANASAGLRDVNRAAAPKTAELGSAAPSLEPHERWIWWSVGTATLTFVLAGSALLAYGFWPAADIPRPPQPIVVTCCNKGDR